MPSKSIHVIANGNISRLNFILSAELQFSLKARSMSSATLNPPPKSSFIPSIINKYSLDWAKLNYYTVSPLWLAFNQLVSSPKPPVSCPLQVDDYLLNEGQGMGDLTGPRPYLCVGCLVCTGWYTSKSVLQEGWRDLFFFFCWNRDINSVLPQDRPVLRFSDGQFYRPTFTSSYLYL